MLVRAPLGDGAQVEQQLGRKGGVGFGEPREERDWNDVAS